MGLLYKQSIPVLMKYFKNLSGLLEKGVKYADEKGMKHEYMLNFRLVHDQRGLIYQVQSCSNTAKFLPARLGIMENRVLEDNETTFDELQARIKTTVDLLKELDENSMDGLEDKPVTMETRRGKFKFETAQSYVCDYAMPNFYFHLTTAYCILRHLGVPIDAVDYLGKETLVLDE